VNLIEQAFEYWECPECGEDIWYEKPSSPWPEAKAHAERVVREAHQGWCAGDRLRQYRTALGLVHRPTDRVM